MAERRMFHTSVVESDAFLDMPPGAQALYFHIGMHADDDGFVNGPRQITRKIGVGLKNLDLLVERGFLLRFDDIVVIKHFRIGNSLQNDRLKPLRYPEVAKQLYIRENRSYSLTPENDEPTLFEKRKSELESFRKFRETKLYSTRIPNLAEPNQTKPNLTKPNAEEAPGIPAAASADTELSFMHGELGKGVILLTQEQIEALLDKMGLDSFDYYVAKLSDYILKNDRKVKNHYATILKWWTEDRSVN